MSLKTLTVGDEGKVYSKSAAKQLCLVYQKKKLMKD